MDSNECDVKARIIEESNETFVVDPNTTYKRYILLILSCGLCIGSYFVYNTPAALEVQLKSVIII